MKKIFGLLFILCFFISDALANDIRFVQITDVRYSKENNSESLRKIIKDVNKQKHVDFIVFTGDNIERTSMDNLKDFISAANKLNKPYYVIIGDKDVNKHKDISKKDYQKYLKKKLPNYKTTDLNYVFEKKGVAFLVADGAKDVIPSTNGYFKEDVINWLDSTLNKYSGKNVIILQHFPIIPPTNNESYVTFKAENYLNVLKKHPNVKAIVSGHFNVNKEEEIDGIIHITTAPPPNYRIIDISDCKTNNPTIWAEVKSVK